MSNESEIGRWVAGLEGLADGLAEGEDFFRVHEERYLGIARRVGGQALLALAPDGVDPGEWRERVLEFEELVFSRLTGGGALEIVYRGGQGDGAPRPKRDTEITYKDVLEWVRAGVEEGGKDKTAIENSRGRADEQIAYDVLTAIRQHRLGFEKKDYSGITRRLEEWVESRVLSGDFADLLVVVLDAWAAALVVVMERDLADWADDEISRAFR